ncbi:hypothetical protein D9619_011258 [Psilocybe cf. subviscida]|uniref:NACHT domain-containing protein n=1 Tax=Psilocybe cf. subviscida TaxID=2480587 RepID=A0A8H5BJI4_9AGAR|nr:hypothetical protein D9619_011258 [Psilocybe cf. subviscida]
MPKAISFLTTFLHPDHLPLLSKPPDMDSNSVPDHKHLTGQPTKRTAASPRPTAAPPVGTFSILNNAQNNNIHGNTFVTNVKADTTRLLDALYRRVAPNAILNAGGRADEVRCHPGTREEVISRIEKWREAQDDPTTPIFWLSGPAGAGKSAIVQTVAERYIQQKVPQANFFFFRADSSRSTALPLVATLLHQIIRIHPSVRELVATSLIADPLIFDSSLEEQLTQVIVAPLRTIQQSSDSHYPLVLLIDGLDECDSETKQSQRQILRAFDKVLAERPCPFRLLVASRNESQIRMTFNQLSTPVLSLYLDDEYSPENDIRLFVAAEFQKTKETHPLSYLLHKDWPSVKDIEGIVWQSSGQFIYAATVVRFISHSSASPELSLQQVLGIAPTPTASPFSQLDAVYTFILSRVDDQQALKDILHIYFHRKSFLQPRAGFLASPLLPQMLRLYNHRYTDTVIHSCVADMSTITRFDSIHHTLAFYHASLEDYFQDPTRSGNYFVHIDAFNAKILPSLVLELTKQNELDKKVLRLAVLCLERLNVMTPDLTSSLKSIAPECLDVICNQGPDTLRVIFTNIHSLCQCDEDVTNYKQILRKWIFHHFMASAHRWDFDPGYFARRLHEAPHSGRYILMAQVDHVYGNITQDQMVVVNTFRPESAYDVGEVALWIKTLLQRIHGKYYPHDVETYQRLVKQWIFWAVSNNVLLSDEYSLPNGHQIYYMSLGLPDLKKDEIHKDVVPLSERYIMMAQIDHFHGDVTSDLDVVANILCPALVSNAHETVSWVRNLLHHIHGEYYPHNLETYRRLMRKWIFWAISNNVLLSDPHSLSDRSQIDDTFSPSSSDFRETELHDLPCSQRYIAMAQIERLHGDTTQNPSIVVDSLRPESVSAAHEIALWVQYLLQGIHKEVR